MRAWNAYLVALSCIAVLVLLSLSGIDKTVNIVYTEQIPSSVVIGEVLGSASIGQTFTAEYNGLSRIELHLATYGRRNKGPLVFHLRASPADDADLITVTIDAGEVSDHAYQVFEFPPLRRSAGRHMYFF